MGLNRRSDDTGGEPEITLGPPECSPQLDSGGDVEMADYGGTIVHFPNDVSVETIPPKPKRDYVTVPRDEFEALVRRDEVENMFNALMKKLLEQSGAALIPPPVERNTLGKSVILGQEEIIQLVDKKLETFKPPDEDEWHSPFGESVYTLLYMYEFQSQSFLYGVFVYFIQMATIALTLADVAGNKIPAMVSITVSCAQGVTIFMLQAYMSDLIEAVIKIQFGFYPEVLDQHPGADYGTWVFSCLAQLTAGLLLLATSFILTMQSETVIDLMLNLTALLFMSEIDDLGFFMAKMGFITDQLQHEAESVADFKVPKRKKKNLKRRRLYFVVLVGLYAGFTFIKTRQLNGHYLPTFLYVQFGDAYNTKIPYFSGILSSGNVRTSQHRQYRDIKTSNISLGYCEGKKSWTFSETGDPCKFFAKSYETETYDVTTIHDMQWEVKDSIQRLQPFDSFSLVSRDCNKDACQGTCGDDGLCQCPHDGFGMDCEFADVCPHLAADERFLGFPNFFLAGNRWQVNDDYQLLQNPATQEFVRVYNMPVYYSNATFPANIIFFGGRRWIITSEYDLFNITQANIEDPERYFFLEKTVKTLEETFHGYYQANYTPFFISDPVDFETPDFGPTPLGLKWWTVKEGTNGLREYAPDSPLQTLLTCRTPTPSCIDQPEDFCVLGECNTATGTCDCLNDDVYGERCELQIPCFDQTIPCSGRGVCDKSSGVCRCNNPWYGKLCETILWCFEEGGECHNGGVCNMTSRFCDCPEDPAIAGYACESTADCGVFGCANGGICGPNGQCICQPPFYGMHCDLVDTTQEAFFCSEDKDCIDGICDVQSGVCACAEPSSYGNLCEHTYNCTWIGCLNNGSCNNATGVCDCDEPYLGPDCSQVPPCSDDDDCVEPGGWNDIWSDILGLDGRCDETSGRCICNTGPAGGRFCEELPSCEDDDDCHQGTCDGSGNCECFAGFSGILCESFVAGQYDPSLDEAHQELQQNITRCGIEDPLCCSEEESPPSYCEDP